MGVRIIIRVCYFVNFLKLFCVFLLGMTTSNTDIEEIESTQSNHGNLYSNKYTRKSKHKIIYVY